MAEKAFPHLEKALSLPTTSGCYLFKNKSHEVIYVGKAKNLRARVSSYFRGPETGIKTVMLVKNIHDFEFFITATESEALVLENNLIKKHSPKYNIQLKDGKTYPYVVVDWSDPFPRLQYLRRPKKQKEREIFGPFPTGTNLWLVLRVLTKAFRLRDCSLREFLSRKEPCLLYQMNQCSAPCVKLISAEEYARDLNMALQLFRGKGQETMERVREMMEAASEHEAFELAAQHRDHLQILQEFLQQKMQKNAELHDEKKDLDIVAFHQGEEEVDMSVYLQRQGLLLGQKNFHFSAGDVMDDFQDEMLSFLLQYYLQDPEGIPEKIVLDWEQSLLEQLAHSLEVASGKKVEVLPPKRKYAELSRLVSEHAQENQRIRKENQESAHTGLSKLRDLLDLKESVRVLECYDIAIWQGQSPTAAQIVFHDGKAQKKSYRYYHLTTRPEGNNDFAMMQELFQRRLKKGALPDVFIVDGGKGQVSVVQEVLSQLNIEVPVVGLAKSKVISEGSASKSYLEKEVRHSEERLIIPGRLNVYELRKCPPLMRILVEMRNEAHRFSRKLHHKEEKKRVLHSWVDDIPGLGPKLRESIRRHLKKDLSEMRGLTLAELERELGLTSAKAMLVWDWLQKTSV